MKKVAIILCIIFVTILAWHKIIFHSFLGEGYLYFNPQNYFPITGKDGDWSNLLRYDNQARFIYIVGEKIFRDNMMSYFIFLLGIIIIQNVVFYFMIKEWTQRPYIAFIAALLFGCSYMYIFEMIGRGYYQWPAERVPNFIFSFLGFYFYIKFLKLKRNYKYYWLSFICMIFSVFIAHISVFFLPVFILYTLLLVVYKKKYNREGLISLSLLLPFILSSLFLLSQEQFIDTKGSIITFFLTDPDIVYLTIQQITATTIPYTIWIFMQNFSVHPYVVQIMNLSLPTAIFYIVSLFFIFKKDKKLAIVALSSIGTAVFISIFNTYTNKPAVQYGDLMTNRYYYTLGFFTSTYLAIFLVIFFKQRILKFFLVLFILHYIFINVDQIWERDKSFFLVFHINHAVHEYMRKNHQDFKAKSIIIVPKQVGTHGSEFYKKFYGDSSMKFTTKAMLTRKDMNKFDPKRDYILEYNLDAGDIINVSKDFKKIFKEIKPIE